MNLIEVYTEVMRYDFNEYLHRGDLSSDWIVRRLYKHKEDFLSLYHLESPKNNGEMTEIDVVYNEFMKQLKG